MNRTETLHSQSEQWLCIVRHTVRKNGQALNSAIDVRAIEVQRYVSEVVYYLGHIEVHGRVLEHYH